MKPSYYVKGLIFCGLAALCACQTLGEDKPKVIVYPTAEPAQAPEAAQAEEALNYLAQVYPDADGRMTEQVTKAGGTTISFVSAIDSLQMVSYTYCAFQRFLADNATLLVSETFKVEVLHNNQVVYLIPRSATLNSTDPLAGVTRTIQFEGVSVTFIIVEDDLSYAAEYVATEIAQATYREITLAVTGTELDPYQEVLANSIGLAYKLIYVDGMTYEEYTEAVKGMGFEINGTIYNVEILSRATLNYALYISQLPPGMQRGFIEELSHD